MGKLKTITRRTLLIGSAAIAGGVLIGYWRYKTPYENPLLKDLEDGQVALTPYIRIDQSGITVITPRAEMGQGVHTTLAALVAEELDVSLANVSIEHGPASKAYFNGALLEEGIPWASIDDSKTAENVRALTRVPAKFLGLQVTGGSSSIPDAYVKMRKAGAAARLMLLEAAALQLGQSMDALRTDDGFVIGEGGARVPYTRLAEQAAGIKPPDDPVLKSRLGWKQLGNSLPRVDMQDKCTGAAEFSIDVRLPGMLHATVRMNPYIGGEMRSFDPAGAEQMPGVRKVIPLDGGIAVVASNTWYAMQAAKAVQIEWQDGPYPAELADHFKALERAFENSEDSQLRDDGDVDAALENGSTIDGEYRAPYLAHATMEPLNAVAVLQGDRLEVWAGTQNPTLAAQKAAAAADVDADNVTVHTTYMGGGFGRRGELDFVSYAAAVAAAMPGIPVQTTWSREEDMQHDTYRPPAIARFRAAIADGSAQALDLKLASPSVTSSAMKRMGFPVGGPDTAIVQAAWDQPYAIENYRVTGYRAEELLPISFWRSVGASQNGFFHESAIDEIAAAAGTDPLQLRLSLMNHDASRKVLEAAADLSNWGGKLPDNVARGVAFVMSFGVPVAEVVEVEDTSQGVRIRKVYAAVDVGIALDPGNIEAQVQSGVNFGLAAAMQGEITVANGVVEQSNFHNYDAIRMRQAPEIEVRILENGDKIRGIGEPGTPPAAPALTNAIFALTGQRIRELPLNKHIDFA